MADHIDNARVQVDTSCSVQEAAAFYGVSEKTIRRRIKAGTLTAFQQATAQGFEWRVRLDRMSTQASTQPVQLDNAEASEPAAAPEAGQVYDPFTC